MEEHDIILVDSGYTLLLYMLLTKELHKNKTYIFSDKTLLNYFEKSNFKLDTVYIDKEEYNKILSIKLRMLKGIKKILFRKKLRKILLSEIEKRTKNKKIRYIGNDHILTTRVIWDKIDEFTMIEDGIASYYDQKLYRKSRRNKFKSKKNLKLGLSPKVKKVIFSGIKEIPQELIKKAEILDFKKVYEEKDDVHKKEILDFLQKAYAQLEQGGKLIIQMVNFWKFTSKNKEGNFLGNLPMIDNEGVTFERSYYLNEDGNIIFKTILDKKVENEEVLINIDYQELKEFLENAGFKNIQFYGGFNKVDFSPESSMPVIVTAEK